MPECPLRTARIEPDIIRYRSNIGLNDAAKETQSSA